MSGTPPKRPPRRAPRKQDKEAWAILKEKWLYTLATVLALGVFVWGLVLGHGTEWDWLAFILALFGVPIALSLDKRDKD